MSWMAQITDHATCGQQGARGPLSDNQSARQVSTQEVRRSPPSTTCFIEALAKADVNVTGAPGHRAQVIYRIPRGASRPASRRVLEKSSKKGCSCWISRGG